MKTKTFLSIAILGVWVTVLNSCLKESSEDLSEYYNHSTIQIPQINNLPDTISTPFFTPGKFSLENNIMWGGEQGKLSLTTNNNNIKLNAKRNLINWNNSLGLNNYPVSIEAENSMGKVKAEFILKSSFGGYFLKLRNNDPTTLEDLQEGGVAYFFDPSGVLDDCGDCDYTWAAHTPGIWYFLSETEIAGQYYSEANQTGETNLKRAFKATLSYDKDTGYPRFTGFWYEGDQIVPGSEKGSIVFYMDISAWENYQY